MHILRNILSGLTAALFQLSLLVFPVITGLTLLLQSPAYIQQALKDSGTYDRVIPAILDQSTQKATEQGQAEAAVLLEEQGVRDTIIKSISPQTIENTSNQLIQGLFGWLQGRTASPEATIDLTATRQAFITNLRQYALDHASTLPQCTLQQLRTLTPDQSVFDAPCLPPGVSPQQAADQFSQDALKNTEFLNKTTLTANDLKNDRGEPLLTAVSWLPDAYQWLMWAPWIMGALILLLGAAIVFLNIERWRGIRLISVPLLVTGLIFLGGAIVYWIFFSKVEQFLPEMGNELQLSLVGMANDVLNGYVRIVALTGGIYALLGGAGLWWAHKLRPQAGEPKAEERLKEGEASPPPDLPKKKPGAHGVEQENNKGEKPSQ